MPLRLILLLIFFVFGQIAPAQQHKKASKKHKFRYGHSLTTPHDDCVFTNKYSPAQRLKNYPFNKAVKILAISYRNVNAMPSREVRIDTVTGKIIPQQEIDPLQYGLWVKNGVADITSRVEFVKLKKQQINNLTNLVYNTDYRTKGNNGSDPGYNCFVPRNALLFIDRKGEIFDYLEVCFECDNIRSKSERLYIGTDCYQKMDLFKKWFIGIGIQYGTIRVDDYKTQP